MSDKLTISFDTETILGLVVDKAINNEEFINDIRKIIIEKTETSFKEVLDLKMKSIIDKVINTDDIVNAIALSLTGDISSIKKEGSVITSVKEKTGIRISNYGTSTKENKETIKLPDLGNGTDPSGFPHCRVVRPAVVNTPIGDEFKKNGISSVEDLSSKTEESETLSEDISTVTEIQNVSETEVNEEINTEDISNTSSDNPITEEDVFEVPHEFDINALSDAIFDICHTETKKNMSSFKDFASLIAIKYSDEKKLIFEFVAKDIINNSTSALTVKALLESCLIDNVRKDGNKKFYTVSDKFISLVKEKINLPFDETISEEEQTSEVVEPSSVQEETDTFEEVAESSTDSSSFTEETTISNEEGKLYEDMPSKFEYDSSVYGNELGSVIDDDDDHEPYNVAMFKKDMVFHTHKGMRGTKYIVCVVENDRNGDFVDKFYMKDKYNVKLGKMPTFITRYSREACTFDNITQATDCLGAYIINKRSTKPYSELPFDVLKDKFNGIIYKVNPGKCIGECHIGGKDLEKIISDVTKELVLSIPRCRRVGYGDRLFNVVRVRSVYVVLDNGMEVPIWKVEPVSLN